MVDHSRDPTAQREPRQARNGSASLGGERVAKALARAGVASRREVERLIEAGRVALNGQVLTTPAVKVEAGDILTVDGNVVSEAEPTRLWRYHKRAGLVTTHKDPQGRPTVFQAVPKGLPRVISVGRLDLNSEGLLLLTNDGALARALELPANGWVRRYRARAFGRVDQAGLDRLKDGITVDGVAYGPIDARLDKVQRKEGQSKSAPANVWISLSLKEGKNREVRRVLEALGLKVNRLIRLAYGPFALGTLGAGAVEEVGPRVIREQLARFIAPENLPTGDRITSPPLRRESAAEAPAEGARQATGSRRARPNPTAERNEPADASPPAKKTHKPGWAKPSKRSGPKRPVGGKAPRSGQQARAASRAERDHGKPASKPAQTRRAGPKSVGPPRPQGRPRSGPRRPSGNGRRR